jgi:hypothetical protein
MVIPYKLDLFVGKIIRTGPGKERTLLRRYTGHDISESEASALCQRIADHKWYVSERLSRDVGFHVAAVDYVENFYVQLDNEGDAGKLAQPGNKIWHGVKKASRAYFEAKGGTTSL